jgi:hypothetical protein
MGTMEGVQRAGKRLGRIIILLIGVLVTACVALTGFVLLQPSAAAYLHATEFDSAAWKARSIDEGVMWPTRLRMVDDLLEGNLRNGLARAQVEELLGPPDKTSYFRSWDLVYQLGPERGLFRIDSEWLVFRLDPGRTVVEYRIVRD